ncbi:MAG: hypothetical protein K8I30_22310, partial [Anaerolineae bacterium]|nr:hypothetical protein [Anaerolineae bacterium]
MRLRFWLLLVWMLFPAALSAQSPLTPDHTQTGWLSILHGDPTADSSAPHTTQIVLTDDSGDMTAELALDAYTAQQLNGRRVQITGQESLSSAGAAPIIVVEAIQDVTPEEVEDQLSLSGSQRWVNV